MNGLTLLTLIVVVLVGAIAYRIGRIRGARQVQDGDPPVAGTAPAALATATPPGPAVPPPHEPEARPVDEYARLLRSYEAESHALRRALAAGASNAASSVQDMQASLDQLSRENERLRVECARYRQVIVDIENNAPPPLLDSPDAPDDLRLIVGIGPVLERLLQQLGVATYRQIARWSEEDIDAFDARLPEFPGRIRRDDWVTQARELHASKYGERP